MNRNYFGFATIFVLILTACGNQKPTSTTPTITAITATSTPDPCSSKNMEASIKSINDLQREFDDTSLLASSVAREQLPPLVTEMQRIRRAAEDQIIPLCLATLKSRQLAHMTTVIETMIAFVGGADTSTLNNGIVQANQEHDLYTLEMARLLGVNLVTATTAPTPLGTQTP